MKQHKNKLCATRIIHGRNPDGQDSIFVYAEGQICIGFGKVGLLQWITGAYLEDICDTFESDYVQYEIIPSQLDELKLILSRLNVDILTLIMYLNEVVESGSL